MRPLLVSYYTRRSLVMCSNEIKEIESSTRLRVEETLNTVEHPLSRHLIANKLATQEL